MGSEVESEPVHEANNAAVAAKAAESTIRKRLSGMGMVLPLGSE